MDELKIFEDPQFGAIRAIEKDGAPWFVAADVCRALDLEDTGRATARLDDDELTRIKIVSGGQGREVIAVNEPGLYSLVLGSRKPEAKAFKRWITHEVLPTLRRTGTYSVPYTMDRRGLTVDDYLRAAHITSNCRNERLPYVLGFLVQAGFSVPCVEEARSLSRKSIETVYRDLCGWITENTDRFHDGKGDGKCYGKLTADHAAIVKPVFDQVCEEHGLCGNDVLKAMRECGLVLAGSGKNTRVTRLAGTPVRCVWVKFGSAGSIE